MKALHNQLEAITPENSFYCFSDGIKNTKLVHEVPFADVHWLPLPSAQVKFTWEGKDIIIDNCSVKLMNWKIKLIEITAICHNPQLPVILGRISSGGGDDDTLTLFS